MPNTNANFKDAECLNAVFNTATDGIIIIDENSIMQSVNPAVAKLFGYELSEMIGQNINLLTPTPHKAQHDKYVQNYITTGIKKIIGIGRDVDGQKKDGSLFPLRLSISEVKLGDNIFFTGILHDLTKEKANEQAIYELNKELEQRVEERTRELEKVVNRLLATNKYLKKEIKDRKIVEKKLKIKEKETQFALLKERELGDMKARFVTMASHEFRTPLSSILTSAELLDLYLIAGQQEKCGRNIERIKKSVSHLTNILNEFLSLSELETDNISAEPISFIFDEFVAQLLDRLNPILKEGQTIKYEGVGESKSLFLDTTFLNHILTNLLDNAIKYSLAEQTISLTAKLEENTLIVEVLDEGIGVPQEDEKYLFARFFRAHNVENIPGTGLGLNIAKKYVELMNGSINFSSKLGKGTTFIFKIPLVQ